MSYHSWQDSHIRDATGHITSINTSDLAAKKILLPWKLKLIN